MFFQLRCQICVDLLHELNGLVGYSLLSGEDDVPEVVQPHQVQSVRHQCSSPLPQLVVVVVDMAEEPIKASEPIVR